MSRLAALLTCLLLALSVAGSAQAEGWAYELADQLMSPFCPGRTVADCPSPQAKTLVVWLTVQEAAGRSREDVQAELVERFGENILPAPPVRGFGVAAYAFPVLAFAAGGALVWAFLRRQTSGASQLQEPLPAGPIDPELAAIVDRDLDA
jgi:cytochrome c-type biogenesis protein CcmH